MTNWKQVQANSNLIEVINGNSVLIQLPKSKFKFWHPIKCVKTAGKNAYLMTISYTDDFKFKAFKNGKGISNYKTKIAEFEMNSKEFENYFVNSDNPELVYTEVLKSETIEVEEIKATSLEIKLKEEGFSEEVKNIYINEFKEKCDKLQTEFGYVNNKVIKSIRERLNLSINSIRLLIKELA